MGLAGHAHINGIPILMKDSKELKAAWGDRALKTGKEPGLLLFIIIISFI